MAIYSAGTIWEWFQQRDPAYAKWLAANDPLAVAGMQRMRADEPENAERNYQSSLSASVKFSGYRPDPTPSGGKTVDEAATQQVGVGAVTRAPEEFPRSAAVPDYSQRNVQELRDITEAYGLPSSGLSKDALAEQLTAYSKRYTFERDVPRARRIPTQPVSPAAQEYLNIPSEPGAYQAWTQRRPTSGTQIMNQIEAVASEYSKQLRGLDMEYETYDDFVRIKIGKAGADPSRSGYVDVTTGPHGTLGFRMGGGVAQIAPVLTAQFEGERATTTRMKPMDQLFNILGSMAGAMEKPGRYATPAQAARKAYHAELGMGLGDEEKGGPIYHPWTFPTTMTAAAQSVAREKVRIAGMPPQIAAQAYPEHVMRGQVGTGMTASAIPFDALGALQGMGKTPEGAPVLADTKRQRILGMQEQVFLENAPAYRSPFYTTQTELGMPAGELTQIIPSFFTAGDIGPGGGRMDPKYRRAAQPWQQLYPLLHATPTSLANIQLAGPNTVQARAGKARDIYSYGGASVELGVGQWDSRSISRTVVSLPDTPEWQKFYNDLPDEKKHQFELTGGTLSAIPVPAVVAQGVQWRGAAGGASAKAGGLKAFMGFGQEYAGGAYMPFPKSGAAFRGWLWGAATALSSTEKGRAELRAAGINVDPGQSVEWTTDITKRMVGVVMQHWRSRDRTYVVSDWNIANYQLGLASERKYGEPGIGVPGVKDIKQLDEGRYLVTREEMGFELPFAYQFRTEWPYGEAKYSGEELEVMAKKDPEQYQRLMARGPKPMYTELAKAFVQSSKQGAREYEEGAVVDLATLREQWSGITAGMEDDPSVGALTRAMSEALGGRAVALGEGRFLPGAQWMEQMMPKDKEAIIPLVAHWERTLGAAVAGGDPNEVLMRFMRYQGVMGDLMQTKGFLRGMQEVSVPGIYGPPTASSALPGNVVVLGEGLLYEGLSRVLGREPTADELSLAHQTIAGGNAMIDVTRRPVSDPMRQLAIPAVLWTQGMAEHFTGEPMGMSEMRTTPFLMALMRGDVDADLVQAVLEPLFGRDEAGLTVKPSQTPPTQEQYLEQFNSAMRDAYPEKYEEFQTRLTGLMEKAGMKPTQQNIAQMTAQNFPIWWNELASYQEDIAGGDWMNIFMAGDKDAVLAALEKNMPGALGGITPEQLTGQVKNELIAKSMMGIIYNQGMRVIGSEALKMGREGAVSALANLYQKPLDLKTYDPDDPMGKKGGVSKGMARLMEVMQTYSGLYNPRGSYMMQFTAPWEARSEDAGPTASWAEMRGGMSRLPGLFAQIAAQMTELSPDQRAQLLAPGGANEKDMKKLSGAISALEDAYASGRTRQYGALTDQLVEAWGGQGQVVEGDAPLFKAFQTFAFERAGRKIGQSEEQDKPQNMVAVIGEFLGKDWTLADFEERVTEARGSLRAQKVAWGAVTGATLEDVRAEQLAQLFAEGGEVGQRVGASLGLEPKGPVPWSFPGTGVSAATQQAGKGSMSEIFGRIRSFMSPYGPESSLYHQSSQDPDMLALGALRMMAAGRTGLSAEEYAVSLNKGELMAVQEFQTEVVQPTFKEAGIGEEYAGGVTAFMHQLYKEHRGALETVLGQGVSDKELAIAVGRFVESGRAERGLGVSRLKEPGTGLSPGAMAVEAMNRERISAIIGGGSPEATRGSILERQLIAGELGQGAGPTETTGTTRGGEGRGGRGLPGTPATQEDLEQIERIRQVQAARQEETLARVTAAAEKRHGAGTEEAKQEILQKMRWEGQEHLTGTVGGIPMQARLDMYAKGEGIVEVKSGVGGAKLSETQIQAQIEMARQRGEELPAWLQVASEEGVSHTRRIELGPEGREGLVQSGLEAIVRQSRVTDIEKELAAKLEGLGVEELPESFVEKKKLLESLIAGSAKQQAGGQPTEGTGLSREQAESVNRARMEEDVQAQRVRIEQDIQFPRPLELEDPFWADMQTIMDPNVSREDKLRIVNPATSRHKSRETQLLQGALEGTFGISETGKPSALMQQALSVVKRQTSGSSQAELGEGLGDMPQQYLGAVGERWEQVMAGGGKSPEDVIGSLVQSFEKLEVQTEGLTETWEGAQQRLSDLYEELAGVTPGGRRAGALGQQIQAIQGAMRGVTQLPGQMGAVGPGGGRQALLQMGMAGLAGAGGPGGGPGGGGIGGWLRQFQPTGRSIFSGDLGQLSYGLFNLQRLWRYTGGAIAGGMGQYAGYVSQQQQAQAALGIGGGLAGEPADIMASRAAMARARLGLGRAGWQVWGGIPRIIGQLDANMEPGAGQRGLVRAGGLATIPTMLGLGAGLTGRMAAAGGAGATALGGISGVLGLGALATGYGALGLGATAAAVGGVNYLLQRGGGAEDIAEAQERAQEITQETTGRGMYPGIPGAGVRAEGPWGLPGAGAFAAEPTPALAPGEAEFNEAAETLSREYGIDPGMANQLLATYGQLTGRTVESANWSEADVEAAGQFGRLAPNIQERMARGAGELAQARGLRYGTQAYGAVLGEFQAMAPIEQRAAGRWAGQITPLQEQRGQWGMEPLQPPTGMTQMETATWARGQGTVQGMTGRLFGQGMGLPQAEQFAQGLGTFGNIQQFGRVMGGDAMSISRALGDPQFMQSMQRAITDGFTDPKVSAMLMDSFSELEPTIDVETGLRMGIAEEIPGIGGGETIRSIQQQQREMAIGQRDFGFGQQRERLDWQRVKQFGGTDDGFQTRGTFAIQRELRNLGTMWEEWMMDWKDRSHELSRAQFMESWQVRAERMPQQFQWQREDLAFRGAQQTLQYAWGQEDIQERMRYATGRERRQLMKQQGRQTISYAMQMGQLQTQEERLDVREQWAREDLERERRHFMERWQMQDEYNSRYRSNWEQRKALQEEMQLIHEQDALRNLEWGEEQLAFNVKMAELTDALQEKYVAITIQMENAAAAQNVWISNFIAAMEKAADIIGSAGGSSGASTNYQSTRAYSSGAGGTAI